MEQVYAGEVVTGEVMCEREVEIDVPYGQVVEKQGDDLPPGRYPATAHVRWTWGHRPHGYSGYYRALNVREGGHWECECYPGYRGQLRPVSDARRAVIAGRFPNALRVWEGPYRSHHPSTFGHGTQRWMLLPTGLLRVDHAVDCSSGWPDYEADGYTYYFAPPQALLDAFGLQADTTFRTGPGGSSIGTSIFGRLSVDELVGDWCSLSLNVFSLFVLWDCALYEIIKIDDDHYRERGCCFLCFVPFIPFDQQVSRLDEKKYSFASGDSIFMGPCGNWRTYASPDRMQGSAGCLNNNPICGWRRGKFSWHIFRDLFCGFLPAAGGIGQHVSHGYRPPTTTEAARQQRLEAEQAEALARQAALGATAPPEPPAPEPPSTATAWIWTEHAGLDPWGDRVRQAMSRVRYVKIDNWRAAHSLEDLKRVAKREGYSAFFVGGSPHAVMLSVPFELTPDQCRESAGCTLYLRDHLRADHRP